MMTRDHTGFGKSWKVMEIENCFPGPGKVLEIFFF